MKHSLKKLAALIMIAGLAQAAYAHDSADLPEGYVTDSQGHVARGSFGDCWHSNEYKSEYAIVGCDKVAEVVVPTPVPVVPAPVPAPVPKKPKLVMQEYKLDAEFLFDFDKASLTPEGANTLNSLVEKVREGSKMGGIVITAYTDQMGSNAYNDALSQSRADTVKAYFVNKGVNPTQLAAVGAGEDNPVIAESACPKKPRAAKIACLHPNRRAVVEITAQEEVAVPQ